MFRGALLFDQNVCISCNLCVKACPSACIALENSKNEAGKKIAKVDLSGRRGVYKRIQEKLKYCVSARRFWLTGQIIDVEDIFVG